MVGSVGEPRRKEQGYDAHAPNGPDIHRAELETGEKALQGHTSELSFGRSVGICPTRAISGRKKQRANVACLGGPLDNRLSKYF